MFNLKIPLGTTSNRLHYFTTQKFPDMFHMNNHYETCNREQSQLWSPICFLPVISYSRYQYSPLHYFTHNINNIQIYTTLTYTYKYTHQRQHHSTNIPALKISLGVSNTNHNWPQPWVKPSPNYKTYFLIRISILSPNLLIDLVNFYLQGKSPTKILNTFFSSYKLHAQTIITSIIYILIIKCKTIVLIIFVIKIAVLTATLRTYVLKAKLSIFLEVGQFVLKEFITYREKKIQCHI